VKRRWRHCRCSLLSIVIIINHKDVVDSDVRVASWICRSSQGDNKRLKLHWRQADSDVDILRVSKMQYCQRTMLSCRDSKWRQRHLSINTSWHWCNTTTTTTSALTYWLEALGHYIKGPISHFEFTEEFIIIKVLTKITIKHKTMMKCEVKSNLIIKAKLSI